jgi:hypothetical protein
MALGSTQPLTEMSTRNLSWGGTGGRCVGLTTLPPSCADCLKNLGASTSWIPRGLPRPVMGLLFTNGNILTGENRSTRRKPCSSATNPTWTGLGFNPGLRDDRPASNHLRQGAVLQMTFAPPCIKEVNTSLYLAYL